MKIPDLIIKLEDLTTEERDGSVAYWEFAQKLEKMADKNDDEKLAIFYRKAAKKLVKMSEDEHRHSEILFELLIDLTGPSRYK